MNDYNDFLTKKILGTPKMGFKIDLTDLHESNLPHQRDVITWAADGGRRAIFASFGLGKTQMQLELARLCISVNGGQALIVCPLCVKQEFKNDAKRLGMHVEYVRNNEEVDNCKTPFMITNYERVRDGNIDVNKFIFVSLDEASVLRSYGSKTYQSFLSMFGQVPFKYVCTATPSPNRYKELIHYAGYLGVMDTGQALTRFFKRDPQKAGNLKLYPHKEREFWLWVSTWATFITKPSDLGYSDKGYDLPNLRVHWHRIETPNVDIKADRDGQTKLIHDQAFDLKTSAKEKRETIDVRILKAQEIINWTPEKHWLVWHHLESERNAIEKCIDGATTVYGGQDDEVKEKLLIGFSKGEYRILATKPEIAGQGCNFQHHCHSNIFLGIDYKFNDFVQSIHRTHRYQQKATVDVHIIYTDKEDNIRKELEAKWARHYELVDNMTAIIKEYGLNNINASSELKRKIGVERKEVKGEDFTYVNNDSVIEYQDMPANSKGMILTSIPFGNHYEYTPSYNDFGHTANDDHFFNQMDFLTPNLLRVLQPGRVAVIHVKDRILFGNVTGYGMPSVNPFHAKTIFHFIKHGFIFMGQITIETDVVRENNQTYRLGWTEKCKDGSKMGVGSPEYLLLFRKLPTDTSRAYADIPVMKSKEEFTRGHWQIDARAKWNSSGNSLLGPDDLSHLDVAQLGRKFSQHFANHIYNYHEHVACANQVDQAGKLPSTFEMLKVPARTDYVWDDIVRMRTLNSRQTQSREQNHICPFQLDIVERAIELWSNPGDEIADPFGGIGSVGYEAIRLGRKAHLCELNTEYFEYGVGYCREVEYKRSVPTLFDVMEFEKAS